MRHIHRDLEAQVRSALKAFPALVLTGPQEAPLMRGVSESMAGRAAVLQWLPLSVRESPVLGE